MAKKEITVAIGSRFGNKIFLIETNKVGETANLVKEEGGSLRTAMFSTIKGVTVNSLRTMDIAGGNKVIVVNGGEKEIKINPATDHFITESAEYNEPGIGEKAVFGNYAQAVEIANANNQYERKRLKEIITLATNELEALEKIITLNEEAKAIYSE